MGSVLARAGSRFLHLTMLLLETRVFTPFLLPRCSNLYSPYEVTPIPSRMGSVLVLIRAGSGSFFYLGISLLRIERLRGIVDFPIVTLAPANVVTALI
jgi:hypothetical protein